MPKPSPTGHLSKGLLTVLVLLRVADCGYAERGQAPRCASGQAPARSGAESSGLRKPENREQGTGNRERVRRGPIFAAFRGSDAA